MSRWRQPGERDPEGDPIPISGALDRYLVAEGLTAMVALDVITGRWPEIAGEDLSEHSRPRSIRSGALIVAVDHAAFGTELRFRADQILEAVKALVGEDAITSLEVRVAP
ncbi:MAG TPA: DUF721 domain-containing protein [Acidimicrobiales bacterium]|nr:DUF721 domain-containing protein [Acidimicrobiales bacterium]